MAPGKLSLFTLLIVPYRGVLCVRVANAVPHKIQTYKGQFENVNKGIFSGPLAVAKYN